MTPRAFRYAMKKLMGGRWGHRFVEEEDRHDAKPSSVLRHPSTEIAYSWRNLHEVAFDGLMSSRIRYRQDDGHGAWWSNAGRARAQLQDVTQGHVDVVPRPR